MAGVIVDELRRRQILLPSSSVLEAVLRRVERHLDQRETGIDQRRANRLDLVGPHPAQDRDQRAARECGSDITNGGHPSNSSIRVMPATNAAWLSIICVDAPTMPIEQIGRAHV